MGVKKYERKQFAALALYAPKSTPLSSITKEMVSEMVKSFRCEIDNVEAKKYRVIIYFNYGPVAGGWPSDLRRIQTMIMGGLTKEGYLVSAGPYPITTSEQKRSGDHV